MFILLYCNPKRIQNAYLHTDKMNWQHSKNDQNEMYLPPNTTSQGICFFVWWIFYQQSRVHKVIIYCVPLWSFTAWLCDYLLRDFVIIYCVTLGNIHALMIYPIPDGSLREDQMSSAPQSAEIGGQLMTGQVALPDNTGPSPLLRPATATNTHGVVPPETHMNNHNNGHQSSTGIS